MIIGITGQACSGKDTLAAAIQEHLYRDAGGLGFDHADAHDRSAAHVSACHHAPILHFADALRDVAEAIFEGRYETQEEKAAIDPFWQERIRKIRLERYAAGDQVLDGMLGDRDVSGRRILQFVGTEMFRTRVHQDIWLMVMERRITQRPAKHHIIADVRFDNEAEFVRKQGGVVIRIQRAGQAEPGPDAHASERGVRDELIDVMHISDSVAVTRNHGHVVAQQVLTGWWKAAGKQGFVP